MIRMTCHLNILLHCSLIIAFIIVHHIVEYSILADCLCW